MIILDATSVDYNDFMNPYRDQALHLAYGLVETHSVILCMQNLPESADDELLRLKPELLLPYLEANNRSHTVIAVNGFTQVDNSLQLHDLIQWGGHVPTPHATRYVFPSNYAATTAVGNAGATIIPHGVDPDVFSCSDTIKIVDRYLYFAPPERGLAHMLDIWPYILTERPKAALIIGSDLSSFLSRVYSSFQDGEDARKVKALLRLPGVHYKVHDHCAYVEAIKAGGVFVYPCDPYEPSEFFGHYILESLYAGTPVVCSTSEALGELWADLAITLPITASAQTWADTLIGVGDGQYWNKDLELAQYSFETVVIDWLAQLDNVKGERQ